MDDLPNNIDEKKLRDAVTEYVTKIPITPYLQRRLFDWRDSPPIPPSFSMEEHHYDDLNSDEETSIYKETILLDSIFQSLLSSKTFMAMLKDEPEIADIPVHFGFLKRGGASYSSTINRASINTKTYDQYGGDSTGYTHLVGHELRHGWQNKKGIFDDLDKMSIESIILLNRAYEADCAAFHTSLCWDSLVLDDRADWKKLLQNKAYTNVTNAFQKQMDLLEEDPEECEYAWDQSIERGEHANETGLAQQAAFEAFFNNRFLKTTYDNHAISEFNELGLCRRKKICPEEDVQLLSKKLTALGSMPYINMHGKITERKEYNPARILDPRYRGLYSQIKEAPTLIHLRHVNKRQQFGFMPKAKPIFS